LSIAEFGPVQKEARVPHPDRIDVHHHLIPPFWAEALPSHGGDFPYAPAAVGASSLRGWTRSMV
jgi:hypothetical protein